MQSFLWGIVGGAAAWFAGSFFYNPIVRFFDLREQVRATTSFFANASLSNNANDAIRLAAAQHVADGRAAVRKVGTDLQAFAQSRPRIVRIVSVLGYRPMHAGSALVGLSNSLEAFNYARFDFVHRIESALKFPHTMDRAVINQFGEAEHENH